MLDAPATAIKDPKRIDITDAREVDAWALLLQVPREEVMFAVHVVGPMSAAVAVHLGELPGRVART